MSNWHQPEVTMHTSLQEASNHTTVPAGTLMYHSHPHSPKRSMHARTHTHTHTCMHAKRERDRQTDRETETERQRDCASRFAMPCYACQNLFLDVHTACTHTCMHAHTNTHTQREGEALCQTFCHVFVTHVKINLAVNKCIWWQACSK